MAIADKSIETEGRFLVASSGGQGGGEKGLGMMDERIWVSVCRDENISK